MNKAIVVIIKNNRVVSNWGACERREAEKHFRDECCNNFSSEDLRNFEATKAVGYLSGINKTGEKTTVQIIGT